MSQPRYSVLIQWSPEDQCYVATLPEWGNAHTHGSTYAEAAENAQEALELLMEDDGQGNPLPQPRMFSSAEAHRQAVI